MACKKDDNKSMVNTQIKSIIETVIQRCKTEQESGLQMPVEMCVDRASYYTGYPKNYICSLYNEINTNMRLCLEDTILINKCLLEFYKKLEEPTFDTIFSVVKDKIDTKISSTQFNHAMTEAGYEMVKLKRGGFMAIEKPILRYERYQYLKKIMNCRNSGKTIYYLDQEMISKNLADPDNSAKYFFVMSMNGIKNDLICATENSKNFIKWMTYIVLPSLDPDSLIVINTISYKKTKTITEYHSKEEMICWLQSRHVPHNSGMRKAELYDLIKMKLPEYPKTDLLGDLIKAHGHDYVYLPLIWDSLLLSSLKKDIRKAGDLYDKSFDINENLLKLKECVLLYINTLAETLETTEKNIYQIDLEIELALENYKIDCSTYQH